MKRNLTITITLALTAVFTLQSVWAQETTSDYQMSVVIDRAYGDIVSKGDFEKAILRINSHHSRFAYATATNLCVAHTMVGQFKHAEHFCDKALEEAGKAAFKGHRKNRDYIAEWAMAYSNRGVLRARVGDNEGAADDFRLAMEKKAKYELPVHNLAVLNLQDSDPVAIDYEPE